MVWDLKECRSVDCYKKLGRIEEGTYGVVYKAQDIETGEIVALKRLKLEKEKEGFPITSLREINALMHLKNHPNIVNIREMVVGRDAANSVFIVMDYVDKDVRQILDDNGAFPVGVAKELLFQLLEAIAFMHENWILHRDLKSTNLLISSTDGQIKVADLGLARRMGSPAIGHLTQSVVTLWYRPPELLLGAREYSWSVDMWSIGCIFGEFLTGTPLFRGTGEIDQLDKIFKLLGKPTQRIWPKLKELPHASKIVIQGENYSYLGRALSMLSKHGIDLMSRLLAYDPEKRISAKDALEHPFFKESEHPRTIYKAASH